MTSSMLESCPAADLERMTVDEAIQRLTRERPRSPVALRVGEWQVSACPHARALRPDVLTGPAGLVLSLGVRAVTVSGRRVPVSRTEFEILSILVEHPEAPQSPEAISMEIWGHGTFGHPNYVEAHVSRLRRKLASFGVSNVIKTARGRGYYVCWP